MFKVYLLPSYPTLTNPLKVERLTSREHAVFENSKLLSYNVPEDSSEPSVDRLFRIKAPASSKPPNDQSQVHTEDNRLAQERRTITNRLTLLEKRDGKRKRDVPDKRYS